MTNKEFSELICKRACNSILIEPLHAYIVLMILVLWSMCSCVVVVSSLLFTIRTHLRTPYLEINFERPETILLNSSFRTEKYEIEFLLNTRATVKSSACAMRCVFEIFYRILWFWSRHEIELWIKPSGVYYVVLNISI